MYALGSSLQRDWALSLIGIVLVGGSAAAFSVLVGRFMGPTALGHAGMSLAIGLGIAQVVTAGLGPATTRFAALRLGRADGAGAAGALRDGLVGTLLVVALCGACAALALPILAPLLDLPTELAGAIAALIVLQGAYIALKAGLYGVGKVRPYVEAEAVAAAAFALVLGAVLAGARLAVIAPFLAANGAFALLALVSLRADLSSGRTGAAAPEPAPALAAPCSESMARYAAIATVGSVAALVRLQLPNLVLGAAWDAAEVGLLQAAMVFLPLVLLLPRAMELALFPTLSGSFAGHEPAVFRQQVAGSQHAVTVALAAVGGGLLLCGPAMMAALYGSDYGSSGAVLDWVVVAAWAIGLAVPAVTALSGGDRVVIPSAAGILALFVSAVAWWFLVPGTGALGAAQGLTFGSVVILAVTLAAAWRRYELRLAAAAASFTRTSLLLLALLYASRALGLHWLIAAAAFLAAVGAVEGRGIVATVRRPVPGARRAG